MKKNKLIVLMLAGCWLTALFCRAEDAPRMVVGILKWEKNNAGFEKFEKLFGGGGYKDVKTVSPDDLKQGSIGGVNVLIVPGSVVTPKSIWKFVPKYLGEGKHIIFEGYPEKCLEKTKDGWKELKVCYPTPGNTHCVVDLAQFSFSGIGKNHGVLKIIEDPALQDVATLAPVEVKGAGRINGRSVNKCQWRLASAHTPGNLEYRDCIERSPFVIQDGNGKTVGQQTALIRHHCRFFNGSTIIFADVAAQLSNDPKLKLLDKPVAHQVLDFLIKLCFHKFPEEAGKEYYLNLFKLKEKITGLKDKYTELTYAHKDLVFHANNNRALGLSETPDIAAVVKTYLELEKKALKLIREFDKWRFNQKEFAVRRKQKLIGEIDKLVLNINQQIDRENKMTAKLIAQNRPDSKALDEINSWDGELNVFLSFADFSSTSWFSPPGYVQFQNGKLINSLGIEGCCSYHYLTACGNRIARESTPDQLERDREQLEIFTDYCTETGLNKFTDHEVTVYPLSDKLIEKYRKIEKPYVVDFETGEKKLAKKKNNEMAGGFGIISRAFEDPEHLERLEYIVKLMADDDRVFHRSITMEGLNVGGYSEYGFEKYRRFLKNRHGGIDRLNEKWGAAYKDFKEIEPLCRYPKTKLEHANWFDWMDFRAGEMNNYVRRVYDTYKKYDRKHPITACINQSSPLQSLDFYEFNKNVDIAGSHNTPTSKPWYQIGLARKGQGAENNEPKWHSTPTPWNRGKEEDHQKCMRYNLLWFGAQGMTDSAIYEWRAPSVSRLAEFDGQVNLGGMELKHFIKWKRKWEKILGLTAPKDSASLGIYWSYETKVHGCGGPFEKPADESLFCQTFGIMDKWNYLLDAARLPYEVVTRSKVKEDALGHLKAIIVPQSMYMERKVVTKLLDYVAQGGRLIIEGLGGRWDEYKNDDNRLFEQTGVVWMASRDKSLQDDYQTAPLVTAENVGPARLTYDHVAGNTSPVLTYTDGYPAVLRVKYGKGDITYVGFSLCGDPDVANNRFDGGSVIFKMLGKIFPSLDQFKTVDCDDPSIRLFTWMGTDGWRCVFVINYSDQWRQAEIKINDDVNKVIDVESGVPVNYKKLPKRGTVTVVDLFPAGARIIAYKINMGDKK